MRFKEFYLTEATIGDQFEVTVNEYLNTGRVESFPELAEATKKVCEDFFKRENITGDVESEAIGPVPFQVSKAFAFVDPETGTEYPAGKSKSKSDIVVNSPKQINLSLKAGAKGEKSTLSSGAKTESMALFFAVMNSKKELYQGLQNQVVELNRTMEQGFMDRFKAPASRKKEIADKTKELDDKIQVMLKDIFQNEEFNRDIVKEALSGQIKFSSTEPKAAAYKMLSFTNDAKKIGYYDILTDDNFIDKVMQKSKFRISYKTDKDKHDPSNLYYRTSHRYEAKDPTKEATCWNDFLVQEYKYLDKELSLLNEEEQGVLQKIWDFFKNIFNKLINMLKKGFDDFCNFWGIIPVIEAEPIDFTDL